MTEDEIQSCIKEILDVVNSEGAAGVIWGIKTGMKFESKASVKDHMIEKITARITDSGEYTMHFRNDDYYIFKNPNRFLNQNLIETNNSVRRLNEVTIPNQIESTNRLSKYSLISSAIATIFIAATFFRECVQGSSQPQQDKSSKVQTQSKQGQNTDTSIQEKDSSTVPLESFSFP